MSLREHAAATMIRVADLEKQRRFYTDVLGLREAERYASGEVMLDAGKGTRIGLYPGQPSKADHTLVCFTVPNIEAAITELKSKGVTFESYDSPELKTVNHVATAADHKGAWFRDPEGNYIGLSQKTI